MIITKNKINKVCDEVLEVHHDRNDRAAIEMVRNSLLGEIKIKCPECKKEGKIVSIPKSRERVFYCNKCKRYYPLKQVRDWRFELK